MRATAKDTPKRREQLSPEQRSVLAAKANTPEANARHAATHAEIKRQREMGPVAYAEEQRALRQKLLDSKRIKTDEMYSEKCELRKTARLYTERAFLVLIAIAEDGQNEAARVKAAETILDRGWGRPVPAEEAKPPLPPTNIHVLFPGAQQQTTFQEADMIESTTTEGTDANSEDTDQTNQD